MRDILIVLVVFGTLPFVLRRPSIGILLWSWLAYMNPHRMTWGFAYNMPLSAITALVLFAGIILSDEPKRFPLNILTITWVLFVIWLTVSTLFAIYPDAAMGEYSRTMKIQVVTLLTILLMTSRRRIEQLVWVITLSIGFFGVKGGVFTILTAGSYRVWGPPDTFIAGNNELALALIMILPMMRYLQMQAKAAWVRYGLLAAMLLSGLAILASYSRGAFLAVIAMLVSILWKGRNRFIVLLFLGISVVSVIPFLPDQWMSRMSTIENYEEDGSAMGRINAWHFAYNLALDRPLTGGGFEAFSMEMFMVYAPVPDDFHDAHSIYFEILAEQGFVGLFLFLAIWLLCFRTGSKIIDRSRHTDSLQWARDLAAMLQVTLLGYAVGGAFLGLAYFDLPYHVMALLVLTRARVDRELAENGKGKPYADERRNAFDSR